MKRTLTGLAVLAAVLLLGVALYSGAWFADDALRLWRISLNWTSQGSPDFNPGTRVLGFEQPLWVMLLSAGAALGGRLAATELALQYLFFCAGAMLLWACHRLSLGENPSRSEALRGAAKLLLLAGLLAASNAFREFLASGLEYALCFFLVALLAFLVARREQGMGGSVILATVAASLLVMTRLDLAWVFAPAAVVLGLRHRAHLVRRWASVAWGVVPLALWLAYAFLHYGTAVSHRRETSLVGWLPQSDILVHGGLYALAGVVEEPITFLIPVLAVVSGIVALRAPRRSTLPLLFALGGLAYLGYGVWRGGDALSGRLLCPVACIGAAALALGPQFSLRAYAFTACYILVFFDLGKVSVLRAGASRSARTVELFREWGIVDDYARQSARKPGARAVFGSLSARGWAANSPAHAGPASPLLTATPGWDGLASGPGVVVEDYRAMGPRRPELQGTVALNLHLKPAEVGTVEPLLSVGDPVTGTQVMAEHLPRNGLRFQIRKAAFIVFSRAVPRLDTGDPHRLVVDYGSKVAGRDLPGSLVVMLDGILLKDTPREARRTNFDDVVAGWNIQAYPGCSERLDGAIDSIEPAAPGELGRGVWPLTVGNRQLVELRVRFSKVTNSSEPIVVMGKDGHADIVFARRVGPGRIVFGQEHWGQMPELGPEVDIDDNAEHLLKVALGPLFAHSDAIVRPDCVRVTMDGRTVLETRQELYPFTPTEVCALDDPFAGSFCGRDFLGDKAEAKTVSLEPLVKSVARLVEERTGPVTLELRFDGSHLGWGLGLLETGVSGAGDILYVVARDHSHVKFYFDHWGIGGITGPEVEVDPQKPYTLKVEMGSLAAPGDTRPEVLGTVRVTLDGRVVLEGSSACHPSKPGQIHVLENALGSGSVSIPFDGTCLSVSRGGETVNLSY